jgi:hypothetical protein
MQLRWFILLVSSICFEGLGRKYLPGVPSGVFYFFKDVVLLAGVFWMRPAPDLRRTVRWLYRGFQVWALVAIAWTIIEVFNPESPSKLLALTGLRAYWLWWLAPVAVASSLRAQQAKRRAIYFLALAAIAIAALGAFQFASPADSTVNLYSTVDGAEVYAEQVASTGRARVSSTFSFLSGFSAFTVLVPTLLLSLGLEAKDRRLRTLVLVATLVCAAALPMSGSRSSVLAGGAVLLITAWTAGLFFTKVGRRILVGGLVAVVLAVVAFPQALEGVRSRFAAEDETASRLESMATVLPPVALATFDYPLAGLGTGMQQNSRMALNVESARYEAELVAGRYLIELGPIGYLLVWIADFGLVVALVRASSILKRGGRRAAAGAALAYATLALLTNSPFDHISQALFFLGCGFILSEVQEVLSAASAAAAQAQAQAQATTATTTPIAIPR